MACFLPYNGLADLIHTGSKIGGKICHKMATKEICLCLWQDWNMATFHMHSDLLYTNWHNLYIKSLRFSNLTHSTTFPRNFLPLSNNASLSRSCKILSTILTCSYSFKLIRPTQLLPESSPQWANWKHLLPCEDENHPQLKKHFPSGHNLTSDSP